MSKKKSEGSNELSYVRAAEMVFGRPQLIGETQGLVIGEYLSARMQGADTPEPKGNRFVGEEQYATARGGGRVSKGYRKHGTTAIINLLGETVNRGAWMGSHSGMTSYEGFSEQLKAAHKDEEIEHIVLDVNSPGGQAQGCIEASRLVRKIAKEKPVTAVVNATAFSAACILISGASKIVVTESAEMGSIGVIIIHASRAAQLKEMGVKVSMFHAGDRKKDLNPFEDISEEAAAAVMSRVNTVMAQAVDVVSEHRKIPKKAIYSLEAGILSAQQSIDAGLADEIGTFDEVLANSKSADIGRTTLKRRDKMSVEDTNTDDNVTKANHDAAVAKAKTDGATEATARLNTILGHADIAGDAGRMNAALDLANSSTSMSAEDVTSFVVKNVPKAAAPTTGEPEPKTPDTNANTNASLSNRTDKPDSLAHVSGAGGDVDDKQPKATSFARDAMKKLNGRR